MITYEKAKELKDAGFPQKKGVEKKEGDYILGEEVVYAPSLSEIIEACGEEFRGLERESYGAWYAYSPNKENQFYGPIAEEAVANLWLELNKK